jgi:hypothetical protein
MHSVVSPDGQAADPGDLLSSKQVRAACGGWSDMTLWRNTHHPDPDIAFPAPDVALNGRKYWRRRTIEAWRTRQAARTRARTSATPPSTPPPSTASVAPRGGAPPQSRKCRLERRRASDKRRRFKAQGDVSP